MERGEAIESATSNIEQLQEAGFDAATARQIELSGGTVESTAARAMHIGKPVAGAFDELVSEPLSEKLKDKLGVGSDGSG